MLSYIPMTAVQGAADAFVEASVVTGLQGTQSSYRLRELLLELPPMSSAAANDMQVQINRRSKAAIASISDPDVIFNFREQIQWATAVGILRRERSLRFVFSEDEDVRIVEETLYLDVDSASTGAANTIVVRLGVETVRISETDRLSLLVRSLG